MAARRIGACVVAVGLLAACESESPNPPESDAGQDTGASGDATTPDTGVSQNDAAPDSIVATGDASSDAQAGMEAGNEASAEAGDDAADMDAAAEGGSADGGLRDLLLYYAFDDGTGTVVMDKGSGGNNGTLQLTNVDAGAEAGAPTTWTTTGRTNGALRFSAADYVTVPAGVFTGASAMTLSVWVNLEQIDPWARVFDFGHGPSGVPANDRWAFFTPNGIGGVDWDFYNGATLPEAGPTDVTALSGTQLPTNVWKHLAVTASAGEYRIYIDGFPAAKATGQTILPSDLEPLDALSALGKSRFGDPNLTGQMDELRIYSRALSVPELETLAYPKTDYASWHFDEGTGTTALDSSDTMIPTTLVGGAAWTTTGRLGGALDLSGVSTTTDAGTTGPFVTFGTNPLANCTTSMTVSTWINLRATSPWMRIFDFGTPMVGPGSRFIYLTPSDGGGIHFAMVSPNGLFDLVSTGTSVPADSMWHHVAVTVGTAGATIFLDGVSVATAVPVGTTPGDFADPSVTANWLGQSRFGDPYLNASLDELRISCRTYTADEIKALAFAQ